MMNVRSIMYHDLHCLRDFWSSNFMSVWWRKVHGNSILYQTTNNWAHVAAGCRTWLLIGRHAGHVASHWPTPPPGHWMGPLAARWIRDKIISIIIISDEIIFQEPVFPRGPCPGLATADLARFAAAGGARARRHECNRTAVRHLFRKLTSFHIITQFIVLDYLPMFAYQMSETTQVYILLNTFWFWIKNVSMQTCFSCWILSHLWGIPWDNNHDIFFNDLHIGRQFWVWLFVQWVSELRH